MNEDMTNPVMNQIEALTGGSLASKVEAPQEQQTPIDTGDNIDAGVSMPESMPDIQPNEPVEQQPVVPDTNGQPTTPALEELMDPVSYNRRRFQKVQPYIVTMQNGDQFETTSLDKDKILYDYYKSLRGDPRTLAIRESLANQANKSYFGYAEVPEGVRESLVGAAGRAAVNTFTSMPFDIWAMANMASASLAEANPNLTDEQKQKLKEDVQKNIEATVRAKNDFTAHGSAYWVDSADTWQKNVGSALGSVAASVAPAFLTGGAAIGVNAAEKAAMKTMTKAATKKLGKEATKGSAEGMAKRALNIKEYKRNPNFDPTTAKKSLALTYTNRIANGFNYGIAAGEAAGASVDVYTDVLAKTNDMDTAIQNALSAGGIVGVLGASPEWVHGAYGALTGASRRMWRAAVAGDKAALRRMVAGDIAGSFALEGASEVAQDVTTLGYMNKEVDPKEEFMTFMLAGIAAGSMTGVSNRRTPSNAIQNATEFKKTLRDVVKARATIFNKMLGEDSASVIRDEDIDKLMEIVDDPNFETLASKIVKKGILENVDKMEDMDDADKKQLREMLERDDMDASAEAFIDFDRNIDNTILANVTDLTPAQKNIFKSIMHGAAIYGIMSGKISNPNELLQLDSLTGLNTGGTESYTEDGNAYIATADNTNLAPYALQQSQVNPNESAAKQTSAIASNQVQNSSTVGMTQGSVDILHEVLGHLFASDVVANGDLPHFLIRYTELLEEAIKEVMPNADIESATPEMLDEYRAYAMANSNKIAEMLGFKGDNAKLFKFFEQMTLANRANFGAIKEYVDGLRMLLQENSDAIRGLIDTYGGDLPDAIKHYADTGEAGLLTNDDLKALSRVFETGLADSNAKLDLMSVIGDNDTYVNLADRLGNRFDKAVEQDKADAAMVLNDAIKQAQDDIENADHAPVNEEIVEALDDMSKRQETEEPVVEEAKQEKTYANNEVTFDGKKYYYLTKRPIEMPNPEAVKAVSHTKEEGEPVSEDKETYRASQLATTGLTKTELDNFTKFAVNEIKKNAPSGVFDELIKQIDQVVESEIPVIRMPIHDAQGRLAGYEFKYAGEFDFGSSKLKLTKDNVFSNKDQRTAALSSDIAYYIMAKRAAKADNRRYSVRNINGMITEYLKKNSKDQIALDSVAGRLLDYENQYQAWTSNEESNTREEKKLLEELLDTMVENNIDFNVTDSAASVARQNTLEQMADWYSNFYTSVEKQADVAKAKKIVANKLNLNADEKAVFDKISDKDTLIKFVQEHSNNFKYIHKGKNEAVEINMKFSDVVKNRLDILTQDQDAEDRDVSSWYTPGKKLTAAQQNHIRLAQKIGKLKGAAKAKAIAEYLKLAPEKHTTADDTVADIWSSTKINALFSRNGVKNYTPLTNYKAQIEFGSAQATYNQEEENPATEVKYTTPEEYGFENMRQMQAIFSAYNVPTVTFDTENYLNAPRTGKLNQDRIVTLDEFLRDFADMASDKVNSMMPANGVLSPTDKLTYVKAVMDAYQAGRAAYEQYVEAKQKQAIGLGLHTSKNGNMLMNDEGYEKFASEEEAAADVDFKQSVLFKELKLPSQQDINTEMWAINNTKFLEPGRIVRFPYGQNPRIGMIAMSFDVDKGAWSNTKDRMFLIRTASLNSEGKVKYEEFYIPRSDFEEMFGEGKFVTVSGNVYNEEARAEFNKEFDEALTKSNKLAEAVDVVNNAIATRMLLRPSNSPAYYLETIERDTKSKKVRFATRPTISQNMADLLKSMTPADGEYDSDMTAEEVEFAKERDVRRNLRNFAFAGSEAGKKQTQEEFQLAYAAYEKSKELDQKTVSDFATQSYMGGQNIVDYMNRLTQLADDSRQNGRLHKVPLWLGAQSGTDRVNRMIFSNETPLVRSLEESAQIMTEASEGATQKLQEKIAVILKDKGAEGFNKFFRNRLKNSDIKAKIIGNKEVDITMGEIQTLYAAKLVEETILPNGKYKYEQSVIDGGNNIYTRLKNKMYKNADELIAQLSESDKAVVEGMLDFFAKYSKSEGKRFVLSLGSYVKSVEKDWALRSAYFTRATKAEMTDLNSLLVAGDLFDTLNGDFKANAIYNSGVKKDITAMKNMLLFGLKYANAEDGLSGYERFLQDFKLRGDSDENSEDFKAYQSMLEASNNLREAVRNTLGKYGFERYMKRLDFEETKPETAFKLLPSWLGKFVERVTRTSMASKLAFKPKNALQNFMGAWQRCCPLSDSSGKWYTTDLLDAIIHIKDAVKAGLDNPFIAQRWERNALGAEYQKVTDANSVDSLLSSMSVWASNQKKKGSVTAAKIFGKMDDFAKKMTKISVGYGTSGADFLALSMAWYKLQPTLMKQAREINKANASTGKATTTAENLFMNHVLRNISSSNFMTRSPIQNWAIRNHLGAFTAFLNDSLQSYGAIGEAWYGLHNAKTDAEKRYLRRVITSNIASQLFYVATQIGALSALYGWIATDDGLTDAEEEYLTDALLRETVGQISSMTPFDQVTRPILESLFLNEKRQSGNVTTSALQDLASALNKGDWVNVIAVSGDVFGGFAGTQRAIDVTDALWSAYSQDDEMYRAVGEVLYGRTKKTALRAQGLRENSKGEIVNKK